MDQDILQISWVFLGHCIYQTATALPFFFTPKTRHTGRSFMTLFQTEDKSRVL